jgi:hypothetical protein
VSVASHPQAAITGQLTLDDALEELVDRTAPPRVRSPRGEAQRGPKGARVDDLVVAEGSRWRVVGFDPQRREAICRLITGSGSLRRFRARQIKRVERSTGGTL